MATDDDVIASAQRFIDQYVTPRLAQGEAPWLDAALSEAAARCGLFGIAVPPAFGGASASFASKARIAEILAGADFGLAMALINSHNIADNLARNSNPEVARRYLPEILAGRMAACTALTEPGAGSDFAAITTRATPVEGGWRIDGAKAWIINATRTGVVVLYAQTEPGSGAAGSAAFVIDAARAGIICEAAITSGLPAMGTGAFRLEGYIAQADEMLHAPGHAFKRAMNSINGARIYVAAMCCGMVDDALKVAAGYGRERRSFGQTLHGHQAWRFALADASVDLEAARLLVADAAAKLDAGADVQGAAARTKVFATRMAHTHLGALLHAMGCAISIRCCATSRRRRRRRSRMDRPRCCWSGLRWRSKSGCEESDAGGGSQNMRTLSVRLGTGNR